MDTIENAIRTFGNDQQIDKMIEECSELILSLQHYKSNRCYEYDVIEEIADVEIVLEQMKLIFTKHDFNEVKKRKLSKLEHIITMHQIRGID